MLRNLKHTARPAFFWWFLFCAQIAALVGCYFMGVHETLWAVDKTYLSWVILAIYMVATVVVGYRTVKEDPYDTKILDFVANTSLTTLGLLGTLIGFIMMLNGVFGKIDPSSVDLMKQAIASMGAGMGTAIWTTVVGAICSLMLQVQLVNLTRFEEDDAQEQA